MPRTSRAPRHVSLLIPLGLLLMTGSPPSNSGGVGNASMAQQVFSLGFRMFQPADLQPEAKVSDPGAASQPKPLAGSHQPKAVLGPPPPNPDR